MSEAWRPLILGLAVFAAQAPIVAQAQDLAGAPRLYDAPPGYAEAGPGPDASGPPAQAYGPMGGPGRALREAADHPKECYAHVRMGPTYAPPPTGPEYVWRLAPAPPGAPGPVWCLTVQPFPQRPVMVAPERMGWIRVLCADETTPGRVSVIQRRLHDQGLYAGGFDGRYDAATAAAVARFQHDRRIADEGYLGYRTVAALEGPPPAPPTPIYGRRPNTFDTGVLSWSGKVQRF
ncbi:MAG: peptidoglycan-binding domain-containing protein [Caulobacteraceae bacterium]